MAINSTPLTGCDIDCNDAASTQNGNACDGGPKLTEGGVWYMPPHSQDMGSHQRQWLVARLQMIF
jgi:hypothetical protein